MNQEKDGSMHRQNMKEHYCSVTLELRALLTQDEVGRMGRRLRPFWEGSYTPQRIKGKEVITSFLKK